MPIGFSFANLGLHDFPTASSPMLCSTLGVLWTKPSKRLSISVVSLVPLTLLRLYIRTQYPSSRRLFTCHAKYRLDGSFNQRMVSPTLLAAEKEEAKAVLTLFLKKQGLSNALAARTINKSAAFIDHLLSQLHSIYKSRYLVGRELTTLEIRDALIPYLETLLKKYGKVLVDAVESFPEPPVKEKLEETCKKPPIKKSSDIVISPTAKMLDPKKLRALARVSEISPAGRLPPHITYLVELGMKLEVIRGVIRKFPAFAYYSLEKIKPVVEFLLELGVSKSDIPIILSKRPQLVGISLSENLIPTMTFLENMGVDKKQWAKVIYRNPALLTYGRQKLNETVDFLYEMGLPAECVGKVLTRFPCIISYSVEDKLRPTAEYFRTLEVDVALLLYRSPQTFGLSIEAHVKPVTQFFLGKGFSIEEVRTMISRFGTLYTFSLEENLIPKWEFFLTTGYKKSDLVKFPQYFGYSLKDRIKPRYALVKESAVRLLLNQVLSLPDADFLKLLSKKMQQNDSST